MKSFFFSYLVMGDDLENEDDIDVLLLPSVMATPNADLDREQSFFSTVSGFDCQTPENK